MSLLLTHLAIPGHGPATFLSLCGRSLPIERLVEDDPTCKVCSRRAPVARRLRHDTTPGSKRYVEPAAVPNFTRTNTRFRHELIPDGVYEVESQEDGTWLFTRLEGIVIADAFGAVGLGPVIANFDLCQFEYADGSTTSMTPTEFKLLRELYLHRGRVVTNTSLLTTCWGSEYRNDLQYLRVWISRLRTKMLDSDAKVLTTAQGIGYALEV